MKEVKLKFELTREEAEAIVRQLQREWVPLDDQKIIYTVVKRLEKELEN